MINKALLIIKDELNAYLHHELGVNNGEDKAFLSSIVDATGKVAIPINAIGITLINIEEERVNPSHALKRVNDNDHIEYLSRPIRVNLYVLFSTHANDYAESLKLISHVIEFFRVKHFFDATNTPTLDESIDKLVFELHPQNLDQIKDIWSFIGGRYLPSVLYRVRGVTFKQDRIIREGRVAASTAPSAAQV